MTRSSDTTSQRCHGVDSRDSVLIRRPGRAQAIPFQVVMKLALDFIQLEWLVERFVKFGPSQRQSIECEWSCQIWSMYDRFFSQGFDSEVANEWKPDLRHLFKNADGNPGCQSQSSRAGQHPDNSSVNRGSTRIWARRNST